MMISMGNYREVCLFEGDESFDTQLWGIGSLKKEQKYQWILKFLYEGTLPSIQLCDPFNNLVFHW
jgi:hypothetical protein